MDKRFTSPIDRASEIMLLAHQKLNLLLFFYITKFNAIWRSPIYQQRYALLARDHSNGVKNGQRFGKKSSIALTLVEEKEINIVNFTGCAKKSPIFSLK